MTRIQKGYEVITMSNEDLVKNMLELQAKINELVTVVNQLQVKIEKIEKTK